NRRYSAAQGSPFFDSTCQSACFGSENRSRHAAKRSPIEIPRTTGCDQPCCDCFSSVSCSALLSWHCFVALAAPVSCAASASPPVPFRFWFPRAGPPRKAASGLGSRAHSLPGARDRRAEQEKRMYLNRITLIGSLGSDAEKRVINATNIAVFSL